MSLDFYQPPSNNNFSFQPRSSQHATNQRYFVQNKPTKKQPKIAQCREIQQFRKTIHQKSPTPQLHEQQKFFPSIRSRVKDAYKMHQLFIINQKQKIRNSMMESKLKLYKQILETQVSIKKSKEKYLRNRSQRYQKIKNSSFTELNEKLHHENRFNMRLNTSLQKLGMDFRSNSLYFRTLDELDPTIHKVNKNRPDYFTIQEPHTDLSKIDTRDIQAVNDKSSYRYLDQERKSIGNQSQDLIVGSMESTYKRQRIQELARQRQKINEMVKMYRQYQENQAYYKKIKSNSQTK